MLKIVVIIITLFCTGCIKNELNEETDIYNDYVKRLEYLEDKDFSEELPFDINIYYDKIIETEIMYKIIIDNPKTSIKNIKALAIHDQPTNDVFPTLGMFDEKYTLIPGVIDSEKNYIEGIILIGYIPFDYELDEFEAEFRVLVKYEDEDSKLQEIFYSSKIDKLSD